MGKRLEKDITDYDQIFYNLTTRFEQQIPFQTSIDLDNGVVADYTVKSRKKTYLTIKPFVKISA
jgi:hypothetical protein